MRGDFDGASQLWKERFPRQGTIDVIKLQNKLTGQCLADSVDKSVGNATIRPCSDETTLWQKIPVGNNVVFRKTKNLPIPQIIPFPTDRCLAKDTSNENREFLFLLLCGDAPFDPVFVWEATPCRGLPGGEC